MKIMKLTIILSFATMNMLSMNFNAQNQDWMCIYDSRMWDNFDENLRYLLVEKSLTREDNKIILLIKSIYIFLKYYARVLLNGETQDRKWLVYTKELDKKNFIFAVNCFKNCKLKVN